MPEERSEFASFLRSRRERIRPEDVGLPAAGRRRTPGLRREELAALAGISVDYVVRLEQGRETNPSVSVLAALARTLQLNEDEGKHLKGLAAAASCGPLCPAAPATSAVDDRTLALLEQMNGSPAFVLNHLTDVLAWNGAYERLMAATGLFDMENLIRHTFLVPCARRLYPDWEAIAREQVGNLRAASGRWQSDTAIPGLVGELSVGGDDFARLWAEHDVGEKRSGTKELRHPVVGELRVDFTALVLPEGEARLVVYLPADEASAAALERLDAPEPEEAGLPRRLRVVGE
ncbi:MAG TPA: helix-turn-helix domain-containing protein [Acidimicrobiales bacterium]|jgi:transcriptional regulator with XRE-family HTH domain